MKKLSIEQKAKAYDEALERARTEYKNHEAFKGFCEMLVNIFPELRESEDDKIKHEIKVILANTDFSQFALDYTFADMNAWLEKQGEQKPVDKVEPKFKIEKGKWYVCIKDLLDNYANKAFRKGDTYLSTQDGSLMPSNSNVPFEVVCPDTYFRDWTIQDAKDGDVLAVEAIEENYQYSFVAIYKERGLDFFNSYCFIGFDGKFYKAENGHSMKKIHPATKEQRNLLFQKMKEAGYEWDDEKKELKKIEQKPAEWSEDNLPEFESYLCLMFQKFRTKGVCTNGEIIDFVMEHTQKLKDTLYHAWSEKEK